MKKLFVILVVISLMFTLCGCNRTNISAKNEVTLTFSHAETYVNVVLEKEEAKIVIDILDGKKYYTAGVPSCGFDSNVAFTVGDNVYAIAHDNCKCIKDITNQKYFDVTTDEIYYIHNLFKKYGGYFPCV